MSNETSRAVRSHSLLEVIRKLPVDVAALFALSVIGVTVYTWPSLFSPSLTTLLGLPLLLVAPGYTLLAVLYPASSARTSVATDNPFEDSDHWLDWRTRVALSVGASVTLVPIVALLCSIVGVALTTVPSVIAVLVATGSMAGAHRRGQLPRDRRLQVPLLSRLEDSVLRTAPLRSVKSVTTVVLAVSVLLAMSTIGYALVVPNDGEAYSSLYLGTETESGDLVSGSFPTEFTAGEERDVVVGVENAEGATTAYTVVVELQEIDSGPGTDVVERTEIRRFSVEIDHGESWERPHQISPEEPGDDLRLTYSLYRGDAPSDPASEEPYRQTYVWIDVEPAET